MEPKGRNIHARDIVRGVQGRQNDPDPHQHIGRQLAALVMLKQLPQPFVSKVLDHVI